MTQSGSSFYETLGRASDAPPDISKTNYLKTTPDLTEAVNTQIDDISKSWDEHFDRMISDYNHMFERGNLPQKLVDFLGEKSTKQGLEELQKWQKWQKKYNKYSRKFKNSLKGVELEKGLNSEEYAKAIANAFIDEPDVEKEHLLEKAREENKIQATNAGNELAPKGDAEAIDLASSMYNGIDDIFLKDGMIIKDMDDILAVYPQWEKMAFAGMKVPIGKYDEDGQLIFETVDGYTSIADKNAAAEVVQGYFAYKFQDIVQGRTGLYKRKFISKLIVQDELRQKVQLDEHINATLDEITQRTSEELVLRLKDDPGYAVTWMKMMLNHPSVLDTKGNISHALVRRKLIDRIIEALDNESLRPEDILGEGKLEFLMVDTFASGKQQFSEFWKKDWKRITNAIAAKNIEKAREIKSAKEAEEILQIDAKIKKLNESKEPIPKIDLDQIIDDLRYDLGYKATDELPNHWQPLLNYRYEGSKDDDTIARQVAYRHDVLGEKIDLKDLVGIIDHDLKAQLVQKYVDTPGGLKKGGSGNDPGTTSHRDNWITTIVNQYTDETDLNTGKTQKWRSNYDQAKRHYNVIFNQSKTAGMDDYDAAVAAEKSVNAMIFGPNSKIQVNKGTEEKPIIVERGIWDVKGITTFDIQGQRNLLNTVKAINTNRSLVNQKEPPFLREAFRRRS